MTDDEIVGVLGRTIQASIDAKLAQVPKGAAPAQLVDLGFRHLCGWFDARAGLVRNWRQHISVRTELAASARWGVDIKIGPTTQMGRTLLVQLAREACQ